MTIDKRMTSGGPETKQMDMQKFIQMADQEKIEFDLQEELFRAIEEKFREQRKPGESFNDWLKRTPVQELRRIELKDGGSIVDLAQYRKDKEKPRIKKLDLSSVLGAETPVSSLSDKDKETVLMLLKMSGIGSKE
jgi:hypothetical protein|tara:strand:- start:80 stop:484 length:405 start_codon:yes stop_codon:yes gene_type:complete